MTSAKEECHAEWKGLAQQATRNDAGKRYFVSVREPGELNVWRREEMARKRNGQAVPASHSSLGDGISSKRGIPTLRPADVSFSWSLFPNVFHECKINSRHHTNRLHVCRQITNRPQTWSVSSSHGS
jgi:hypothetical protein